MDANQEVFDLSVRYAVFLERYKNGSVRRIQEFLQELDRELVIRIETLTGGLSGKDVQRFIRERPAETARLKALLEYIRDVEKSAAKVLEEKVVEEVSPIAERLTNRNAAIAATVGIEAAKPRISQIEQIIRTDPFQGNILRSWVREWSEKRIRRATSFVRQGLVAGDTTRDIAERLNGVLGVSRRSAETIVRTASNHARSVADTEFAKANEDKINYMLRRAILDSRTSDLCKINDGRQYQPDEAEGVLPAHPNCRSQWIIIYKGQGRPDDDDYFDWLRKQSEEMQIEALGKKRAKLFRDGELTGPQLINEATGEPYTLDQLRRREAEAFEKAGLDG